MLGTLGYAGRGRPCSKDWDALVKGALDSNLAYKTPSLRPFFLDPGCCLAVFPECQNSQTEEGQKR